MRHIPVEEFFRNPDRTYFAIAPDGKHLAFLAPYETRMNVHVQNVDDGTVTRLSHDTERSIHGLAWANSSTLVFSRDVGGDENDQIFVVGLDGSEPRNLTPFPGVKSQLQDVLEDRDDEILISMNKRRPDVFDIYKLTLSTGEMTMVAENPGGVISWDTDHDGNVRIAIASDGVNRTLLYRDTEQEEFRALLSTDFRETVNPMMFDFDNQHLLVYSNRGRDTAGIFRFDVKTAKETELMFEASGYDMGGIIGSDKRKLILGASYYSWRQEYIWVDDFMKSLHDKVKAKVGDKQIFFTDCSRDEDRYIVLTYDDRNPQSYYLYDVPTDTLKLICETRPWLKEADLSPVRPIQFQTRDGLTVHGYLAVPNGKEAKNLPVVINPHGGPWVRDHWGFDPTIQFLANRGYAVLQINYRGSTGYGRKFWEASFKQWGRAMQNDLSDGVKWLIDEGIADPARVAILGGSYGGYAVLAGLCFTPELYCCGVDIVGVSNLFTFRKTIPEYWKPLNDMSNAMIGDPVADEALLRSVSPYFHAGNIRVPLLVFQGARDPRVNIAESDQIVEALRSRDIDVEYIVKENEGHGFSNQENKFEMYGIIENFLKKHLG